MTRRRICLYVTGSPSGPVLERYGDYFDWFSRLTAEHDVDLEAFDGTTGRLPDLAGDHDGVVITGSPASLTTPEPWMEATIELIRSAYRQRRPLLGVCFGHQLIGAAFGGSVIRNPAGWQLASRPVTVHERGRDDPLFAGLPDRITVNLSHQDVVAEDTLAPANGVEILASNAKARVAALAAGPTIRGVQFHPEFSGQVTRAYIEARHEILAEESRLNDEPDDHPDALLEQVAECPQGQQVFHNFIDHFVA